MGNRPQPGDFDRYLPFFLKDNPDAECAKAGHPSYGPGVKYVEKQKNELKVRANYFMAYHTILKTSKDYYEAMRAARKIAANITDTINIRTKELGLNSTTQVFPYRYVIWFFNLLIFFNGFFFLSHSIFYVFYEQYLTMWEDTVRSMVISFLAIFITTFLLLGLDLWSAVVVVTTISMILINLGGLMYFWSIELNAVSLVNLVMVSAFFGLKMKIRRFFFLLFFISMNFFLEVFTPTIFLVTFFNFTEFL